MVLVTKRVSSKILKRLFFIFSFLIFLFFHLRADVGRWDIIAFSIHGKPYYLKVDSPGRLVNNDFCYYGYSGEYLAEVSTVFFTALKYEEPEIFEELDTINLGFTGTSENEKTLFILKKLVKLDTSLIKEKYRFIFAINANTYGYTYTHDLNEKDNSWLKGNSMDTLFSFNDGGICQMALYGIKGRTTKEEIAKMKSSIQKLTDSFQSLDVLLAHLYRKKIIMIGFCSC